MKITRKQLRQIIKEELSRLNEDTFPGLPIPGLPSSDQAGKVAEITSRLMVIAADNPELSEDFARAAGAAALKCAPQALTGGLQECVEKEAGNWLSANWSKLLLLLASNPGLLSDLQELHNIAKEMGITLEMPAL